jgi:uncharacterized repeat protein (TIGR03803 family)
MVMQTFGKVRFHLRAAAALPFAMAALAAGHVPPALAGGRYTVLYTFQGTTDGNTPNGNLVADSAGNLYGTASGGGGPNCNGYGCGVVFEVTPQGQEKVLYAFAGKGDGSLPQGGLIRDKRGNLYGTATTSGTGYGGVVFKITPSGREKALYAFTNGNDGGSPQTGVIRDREGNLYGTTELFGRYYCGTIFKIAPDGTETTLYTFTGGRDGFFPSGLIQDNAGNLYGTTLDGGAHGSGTVFRLASDGTFTVLHSFGRSRNGVQPGAGVIVDKAGNLYGTTHEGGADDAGAVFRLAPDGSETVLYSFNGGSYAWYPNGLIEDREGNFYGATQYGGSANCFDNGCGSVFELAPDGTGTVLYAFTGGSDGGWPYAGVIADKAGNLYGTTSRGGTGDCAGKGMGCGVVFEIKG